MKIILAILFLFGGRVYAHGGEDHSAPSTTQTATTTSGAQLTVVSYQGPLEIFVKYPTPELDEPVTGRLFFADYATNHPVNPSSIELSFPGALGAKVSKQPTKISDGVYEFTANFVRDTGHTALIRYTYGGSEQLASLSPFYAGMSAERQLKATDVKAMSSDRVSSFPTWILIPIILGLLILAFVLLRRRRQLLIKKAVSSSGTSSTTITQTNSLS